MFLSILTGSEVGIAVPAYKSVMLSHVPNNMSTTYLVQLMNTSYGNVATIDRWIKKVRVVIPLISLSRLIRDLWL